MTSWLDHVLNKKIEIQPRSKPAKKVKPLRETIEQITPANISNIDLNSKKIITNNSKDAWFFRGLEKANIILNKSQLEAVKAPLGANCILAPAGSGKTTTIIARIAYLIAVQKIDPKSILAVTFTKKATEEMKDKLQVISILSKDQVNNVVIRTLHSVFYKLLQWSGYQINLISNERKRILITNLLKDTGLRGSVSYEDTNTAITFWKNNMLHPEDISDDDSNANLVQVYQNYENYKSQNRFLDFDDLIIETNHLIKKNINVRKSCQNRFKHILVDEMQDTSKSQWEIVKMIAEPDDSLFVVGDDDQAIYGFRGTSPEILLSFSKIFPKSHFYQLNVNYRSCPKIIGLSSKIISNNETRIQKEVLATDKVNGSGPKLINVEDESAESLYLAGRIKTLVSEERYSFNDFAVLFRTNSYVRSTLETLLEFDIPFIIDQEGEGFYEKLMVSGLISHLRLALDPNDFKSFSKISPSLYLSKEKETWIIEGTKAGKYSNILEAVKTISDMPDYQIKNMKDKISLINSLGNIKPVEAIRLVRNKGNYDSFILKGNNVYEKNDKVILEDLEELEASAKKFQTVKDFIEHIDKISEIQQEKKKIALNPNADVVRLLSIHKSKGMEFKYVFIIGAIEDVIPHARSSSTEDIEEERRLMYVATSRAKKELEMIVPKERWGEKVTVSRFLSEL